MKVSWVVVLSEIIPDKKEKRLVVLFIGFIPLVSFTVLKKTARVKRLPF